MTTTEGCSDAPLSQVMVRYIFQMTDRLYAQQYNLSFSYTSQTHTLSFASIFFVLLNNKWIEYNIH